MITKTQIGLLLNCQGLWIAYEKLIQSKVYQNVSICLPTLRCRIAVVIFAIVSLQ